VSFQHRKPGLIFVLLVESKLGLKWSHKLQKLLNNDLLIYSLWFYARLEIIKANGGVGGMAMFWVLGSLLLLILLGAFFCF
jgi:hypothetical protein